MNIQPLANTARMLVADGRGLLAMDESNPTCDKRLAALGIPQTKESRRAYRELIVTTPGLSECISGVILYDETIRQSKADGTSFLKVIVDTGIIPGIISSNNHLRQILLKRSAKPSRERPTLARRYPNVFAMDVKKNSMSENFQELTNLIVAYA